MNQEANIIKSILLVLIIQLMETLTGKNVIYFCITKKNLVDSTFEYHSCLPRKQPKNLEK